MKSGYLLILDDIRAKAPAGLTWMVQGCGVEIADTTDHRYRLRNQETECLLIRSRCGRDSLLKGLREVGFRHGGDEYPNVGRCGKMEEEEDLMETTVTSNDVLFLSREEAAARAQALYDQKLRALVEAPANIGKMLIIDVATGDYAIDELGFDSADTLRQKNPNARLFGIRIGYNIAASLGGTMERTAP